MKDFLQQVVELTNLPQESEKNYKLTRESDNLTKYSSDVLWVEFNENGSFKSKHEKPAIGYSLLMSPFNQFFTWQTTGVIEILENQENLIKFKTNNSIYTLEKLNS